MDFGQFMRLSRVPLYLRCGAGIVQNSRGIAAINLVANLSLSFGSIEAQAIFANERFRLRAELIGTAP
jgi:hypothetical protein